MLFSPTGCIGYSSLLFFKAADFADYRRYMSNPYLLSLYKIQVTERGKVYFLNACKAGNPFSGIKSGMASGHNEFIHYDLAALLYHLRNIHTCLCF